MPDCFKTIRSFFHSKHSKFVLLAATMIVLILMVLFASFSGSSSKEIVSAEIRDKNLELKLVHVVSVCCLFVDLLTEFVSRCFAMELERPQTLIQVIHSSTKVSFLLDGVNSRM
jgi:hypothetical protein